MSDPVPCGTCNACCRNELLVLHPEAGDKPHEYLCRTLKNPLTGEMCFALAQKENGDCYYLGEVGCTIYDMRPAICREFDCRGLYRKVMAGNIPLKLAMANASDEVFLAGKERIT